MDLSLYIKFEEKMNDLYDGVEQYLGEMYYEHNLDPDDVLNYMFEAFKAGMEYANEVQD